MIDLEKVIKGLDSCAKWMGKDDSDACNNCPYHLSHFSYDDNNCIAAVNNDAIALLKEHEAKWIYGEDETGIDGWHCSECNFFEPWFYDFTDDIDFIRFYKHCPNCGSRMTSYTVKPTQDRW